MDPEIQELQEQIDEIKGTLDSHEHKGFDTGRINFLDIIGKVQTVDAVPSATPRDLQEQIKFYQNGGTKRLYIFDSVANTWHYATLT